MKPQRMAIRRIERFMHRHFMALPRELSKAAVEAWLTLQVIGRPDNQSAVSKSYNLATIDTFASLQSSWCREHGIEP